MRGKAGGKERQILGSFNWNNISHGGVVLVPFAIAMFHFMPPCALLFSHFPSLTVLAFDTTGQSVAQLSVFISFFLRLSFKDDPDSQLEGYSLGLMKGSSSAVSSFCIDPL